MRAISGALLTLLAIACGPSANDVSGSGGASTSVDSGSDDGADASSADDSTTGDPACDPSTPDIADAVTVTIRNEDSEPRYVNETSGCVVGPVFELGGPGSGEPISWIVDPCVTCAAVIDGACACPAACPADSAIRIDPGGVYVSQWTGAIAFPVELSAECAHPECGTQCTALAQAEPGSYVARVVAGTTIDCGGGPCDCQSEPAPAGWCRVGGVSAGGQGIVVERVFEYPSAIAVELVIGGS